jgi:hypothetical protein
MAGFNFQDIKEFAESDRKSKSIGKDSMEKVDGKINIYLHGNRIATWDTNTQKISITSAGWQTKTTKDRLNKLLPSGFVSQKKGVWYLNDAEFHDDMIVPAPPTQFSAGTVGHGISKGKKVYIRTDAWRGYEMPLYAVAGASDTGMWEDSPSPSDKVDAELQALRSALSEQGIKTRISSTQSSNVFMAKRWIVVDNPDDYERAEEITKEFLKSANYLHDAKEPEADKMRAQERPTLLSSNPTKLPNMLGVGKGWHRESQRHSDARYKGMR